LVSVVSAFLALPLVLVLPLFFLVLPFALAFFPDFGLSAFDFSG
jgi:hypothetical protein